MAVPLRGMAMFVAAGVANVVHPLNSTVPLKNGDTIIDAWDMTNQQCVLQFLAGTLTASPGGNVLLIEELPNPPMAGHVVMALIGVGPLG